MNLSGKRALVTGGSSGIGLEIAKALIARGARVVVTGRREDQVQNAVRALGSEGVVKGVAADVTTSEGRRVTLETALDALGGLDILINNAGGMRAGRLESLGEDDIRQMIELNLAAPILLTRSALPHLKKSGEAMIVDISAATAQVGAPFYATYAAAKAGIALFGESLRRELDGEGVRVLTVYPVATDTPMMAASHVSPPGGRDSAEAVALATVEAMIADRLEVVRGGAERLALVALNRSDPAAVDRKMAQSKAALERDVQGRSAL